MPCMICNDQERDLEEIQKIVSDYTGKHPDLFLTASPEARARRRCLELRQKGKDADYETVLADIRRRDEQDTNRPIAPLRQAEDAIRIDTSEIDFDQSFELLKRTIREHL